MYEKNQIYLIWKKGLNFFVFLFFLSNYPCTIVSKEAIDRIFKHLCNTVPAQIWPANREKAARE